MDSSATAEAVYKIRMGMEAESAKAGKGGGGDTHVTIHAPITRSASTTPKASDSHAPAAKH